MASSGSWNTGSASADIDRNAANFVPLSPVSFLERAADVYPGKVAVIDGERTFTYRQFRDRVHRLASAR